MRNQEKEFQMRFIAQLPQEGIENKQPRKNKKRAIFLILLLVIAATLITVSYMSLPTNKETPQIKSDVTTVYPTNHTVHVDHSQTSSIVVDITQQSIPDDVYFIVNTTSTGTEVPADAIGHQLMIDNTPAAGYFDVKVTTNMTLTPEIMVKITITNPVININSAMYYWNSTQGKWVAIATEFQSPHTASGYLSAMALTGTPIGIFNGSPGDAVENPTATPTTSEGGPDYHSPMVAPEYQWGALLAIGVCFAALAVFKVRKTTKNQQ